MSLQQIGDIRKPKMKSKKVSIYKMIFTQSNYNLTAWPVRYVKIWQVFFWSKDLFDILYSW